MTDRPWDDMAEHYGQLPVFHADRAGIMNAFTTGDERTWEEEAADIDVSEAAESISRLGMLHPITLGTDGRVLDGHHRLLAAQSLGIDLVPVRVAPMPAVGSEGAIARVRELYDAKCAETVNGCSDDLELFLADLSIALTGETCARCGQWAEGFATIDDRRYCHGGQEQTCYELAQERIGAERYARMLGYDPADVLIPKVGR